MIKHGPWYRHVLANIQPLSRPLKPNKPWSNTGIASINMHKVRMCIYTGRIRSTLKSFRRIHCSGPSPHITAFTDHVSSLRTQRLLQDFSCPDRHYRRVFRVQADSDTKPWSGFIGPGFSGLDRVWMFASTCLYQGPYYALKLIIDYV